MININSTKNNTKTKTHLKKGTAVERASVKGSMFSKELTANITDSVNSSIDEELTDLKDSEKRFIDTQSLYELAQYKRKIQKILKLIQSQAYQTQKLKRRAKAGMARREDFTIVNTINSKLAELSINLTSNNKAFDLMKTIDEIRGLVFDLVY